MYAWERDILKEYAVGNGVDMGCGRQKIGPFGVDTSNKSHADLIADMSKTGLPDETLDYIVSNHALEHTGSAVPVLREWFRLLKHGGRLAFFVPDGSQVSHTDLGNTCGGHLQLFTVALLGKLVRHAGFRLLQSAVIAKSIFIVAEKP